MYVNQDKLILLNLGQSYNHHKKYSIKIMYYNKWKNVLYKNLYFQVGLNVLVNIDYQDRPILSYIISQGLV